MYTYQTIRSSLFILASALALTVGCGPVDDGTPYPETEGPVEAMGGKGGGGGDCDDDDDKSRKVAVCHHPPGNPKNAHTIYISKSAVAAHLKNHKDDYLGECKKKPYDGDDCGPCDL